MVRYIKENNMISASNNLLETDKVVDIMKNIIAAEGECKLVVTGNSMFPTLKHKRDSVILVSPNKRCIKKGEIVFIQRETGEYILHRVYKTYEDYFIMNGDNQEWCENVKFNSVIAVAKKIVRKNRQISCDNLLYKYYVSLWMILKNNRKQIYRLYSYIRRK